MLVGGGEGDRQAFGHRKPGATQILRELVPPLDERGIRSRQVREP
jgi:hypothetical protein